MRYPPIAILILLINSDLIRPIERGAQTFPQQPERSSHLMLHSLDGYLQRRCDFFIPGVLISAHDENSPAACGQSVDAALDYCTGFIFLDQVRGSFRTDVPLTYLFEAIRAVVSQIVQRCVFGSTKEVGRHRASGLPGCSGFPDFQEDILRQIFGSLLGTDKVPQETKKLVAIHVKQLLERFFVALANVLDQLWLLKTRLHR